MIAMLPDVHSNQEALTVALAALVDEYITNIYCTGDLVEFTEVANKVIGFAKIVGSIMSRV